jgi:hypothetical protein
MHEFEGEPPRKVDDIGAVREWESIRRKKKKTGLKKFGEVGDDGI